MKKDQNGIAHIGLMVLAVVVVLVGVSGWFVWSKNKVTESEPVLEPAGSVVKEPSKPVGSDSGLYTFKELGISMNLEEGWSAAILPNEDSQEDPDIVPVSYAVTKPGVSAYINVYRTSIAAGFPGCETDDEMQETEVIDVANTGIDDVIVYNNSKTGLALVSNDLKFGSKTKSLSAPEVSIASHLVGDIYYFCSAGTAPLDWSTDFDNNTRSIDAVIAMDKATSNTMAVPKSTLGYDEIFMMLKSVKKV